MLILESPWTRQPQLAAKVRAEHAGKIIALWNTASPGGIVYDASGGYHAPGGGRLVPSEKGIVWNGARTYFAQTTRTLPALAAGTPYLLSVWVNLTTIDANGDCFATVGAQIGTAYGQACAIYTGGGGGTGGVYVSSYGVDVTSASTGLLAAGAWYCISTIYTGGTAHTARVVDPAVRPTYVNGAQITMVMGGTSAAEGSPSTLSIAAEAAKIASDGSAGTPYCARANVGSVLFATGSVAALTALMRQHYENPYSLLAPRRIHIPTAAAAATAPTITALSAISITATSAQPRISYS